MILELNSRIPLWAASLSTAQSPILVVDQHTDFKVGDVRDGVHPNEAGDRKMAAKWYPALVQAIHLVPPIPEQDSQQAPLSYEL